MSLVIVRVAVTLSRAWKQHSAYWGYGTIIFEFLAYTSHSAACRLHSHFVFSLTVSSYFLKDAYEDQLLATFAFCLACAASFRQERYLNVNALVALVACFPRVNWWNMQRRMQMTSAVIADYHGNIYGRYKVRAQKKRDEGVVTSATYMNVEAHARL